MSRGPILAVVFDLDGVLVDTEPLHLAATRVLITPATLEDADYEQFIGRGGFKEWLEATYGVPRAVIDARYTPLFLEELTHGLPPLDGAVELLEAIRARGLPLAVASQSSRPWVEATLEAAALRSSFDAISTAEEAGADKPAPDVYLHAADALGIEAARCLAVEDSVHGVESAVGAGMTVVQSRQTAFAAPPQPGADAVIDSLRAFDLGWLDRPPGPR
ncbi:MAG: HAD-IA family hydrolase [Dehalococcoidia bacterium]